MGLYTLVFDHDEDALGAKSLADAHVPISCYDAWGVLNYTKRQPAIIFDAVICAGTDCPDVMALVAKEHGLVGPSVRTAEISMDKWMQKRLFSDAGINTPHWVAGDQVKLIIAGDTVVVKPVSSRGSRGIMRVLPGENVIPAIDYAKQFDPREHTIVEEWIDGVQLSSESLVQDGKIIYTAFSERNYSELDETHPFVIEDGGDMPPSIPLVYENNCPEKAKIQLQKCVTTMGLRTGTLKGDLVWDGQAIWVIEVACRLSGGSFCSDQIPEVWGVDFVGMAIRLALGEKVYNGEIKPHLLRHMAQRFYIPPGTTNHPDRGPGFISYGPSRAVASIRAQDKVDEYKTQVGLA